MKLRTGGWGTCIVVLFSSWGTLVAYPCGFKRLKKKTTHISIFYDVHIEAPNTSVDEMEILPYKEAKKKLYPSERRFLTALARLNKSDKTALIWEFRTIGRPATPYFMGLAPKWIQRRFKNITFTYADDDRVSYRSIFNNREPNITGATFENPMPFVATMKKNIKKQSGDAVWQSYKRLYSKVKRLLYNDYRENYYVSDGFEFVPTLAYDQIADLEILGCVLSCKRENIIVYCGGDHVERIAHFLEIHAGFEVIDEQVGEYLAEISPRLLDFLDKEPVQSEPVKKKSHKPIMPKNTVPDLMSGGLQFLTFEPFFSTLSSI